LKPFCKTGGRRDAFCLKETIMLLNNLQLWPNRNDFLHVVTFGIAIGLEVIGVMIAVNAAASRAKKL
jgi:hypothetical protein